MYKNILCYRQTIKLSSVESLTNKILTTNLRPAALQHELPEADLTQGRGTPDKNFIFKSVSFIMFIFVSPVLLFQSNLYQLVIDKSFIRSFKPQA